MYFPAYFLSSFKRALLCSDDDNIATTTMYRSNETTERVAKTGRSIGPQYSWCYITLAAASSLWSRVALKRARGNFRIRVRIKLTRAVARRININIKEDGHENCERLTHRREWKLNYRQQRHACWIFQICKCEKEYCIKCRDALTMRLQCSEISLRQYYENLINR